MKILFTWHAAVEPEYRKIFREMVQLGHSLSVIAPHCWTEGGRLQRITTCNENGYDILPLSVIFQGKIKRFFYPNFKALIQTLLIFKPDIVHIFEEPYSLSCFQLIVLAKLFCPNAKIAVQSFENIYINQKFPFSIIEKFVLKNTNILISVPEEGRKIWKTKGFLNEIKQVPVGIDTNHFNKTNDSPSELARLDQSNKVRIAYIGRLTPEKGLSVLFEAFSRLHKDSPSEVELLIVGSGEKDNFKSFAVDLGIDDSVIFLNSLENKLLPALYSKIDILVLPSLTTTRWKEQFGRVLIEAMACEAVVIGSSSGEIPNVIGDAGLVFEEGNAEALLQALKKVVLNKDLRETLKKAGRERVLKSFTWVKVAEKLIMIYK